MINYKNTTKTIPLPCCKCGVEELVDTGSIPSAKYFKCINCQEIKLPYWRNKEDFESALLALTSPVRILTQSARRGASLMLLYLHPSQVSEIAGRKVTEQELTELMNKPI